MKTRLITAGVAIIVFLAVLIFGEMNSIVITIAIALANTIMCGEYLSAKKLNKNLKLMIPCLLAALLIVAVVSVYRDGAAAQAENIAGDCAA